MKISFELTMPNRGSWNGRWSGENQKYFIIKTLSKRFFNKQPHFNELQEKGVDNFYYQWKDGWGANITVEIIDAVEAKKRRKQSEGFAGYDWMVKSILLYGKILT